MNETFRLANEMSASMSLNAIVCYMKKIPLIGKAFKNVSYEHIGLKHNLSVIAVIIRALKVLFGTLLSAVIVVGIPLFIYSNYTISDRRAIYLHVIIVLYFLFGGIINADILSPSRDKFIFIKVMKMNARDYILSNFLWLQFLKTISEMIVFLIIGAILKIDVPLTVVMVLSMNLFRCFGEMVHIMYYEKFGKLLSKSYAIFYGFAIALLALAIVPIVMKTMIQYNAISLYVIFIIFAILGLVGYRYLYRYDHYVITLNEVNRLSELSINVNKVKKDASFADVKINTKKFNQEELRSNEFSGKRGYDYLNAIFFKRHRRIVLQPVLFEVAVVAVALIGGIVASFMVKDFHKEYTDLITRSFTVFIFIMYAISSAGKMTKAMFYNCDISLLRYGFYKKEKAVLTTFSLRLNKLAFYNLIPAVSIGISLVIIGLFCEVGIRQTLPIAIFIVILSLFFTIHHLFLYYILQPYTTELEVKNPLFTIINGVTYFLSYICLQIHVAPVWLLSAALGATVVYIIVALVLVYLYASKTFVVK
ncbi:hypothetical protein [Anaeromicropila herbilytica]|uniref:Uncharacterized protein n=1 Tax=Anaeromicropila herbilytica TaxID=2785025 RepID=A0A7R7EJ48_9FIRM|nr:hypothetical protein [Anaeromicropila herbilytica]BCN29742.1 hypothetical protein bsdtb5_10370 [Anaeromicropila herbilytica]